MAKIKINEKNKLGDKTMRGLTSGMGSTRQNYELTKGNGRVERSISESKEKREGKIRGMPNG